jgi:hypothetical protein
MAASRVGEEPPDDEQIRALKHVEAINLNKLKANCASCWSYYTVIFGPSIRESKHKIFH